MITLAKSGNAVVFTFSENGHYLFDGEIEVPINSLTLVTDNSQMATFRKSASNDIFISATYDELGMSKSDLESWFKTNACGTSGGGSGSSITSGDVQTMIDASISGKADSSAVTEVDNALSAHTADTNIHVTSEDKSNWNAKSDFSGSYNDLTDKPTIPTVPTSNSAFTNDEGYITDAALEPYAMTSAVTNSISAATDDMATKTWVGEQGYLTEHQSLSAYSTTSEVETAITAAVSGKADSTAVTQDIAAATSGLQETLVSGTNIKTINNESILGSGNITISGGSGGSNAVEVTQAEYDALVSAGTVQSDTFYIITDATEINLSGYAQTSAVTAEITAAVSGKVDTSSVVTAVTSGSTDAEIPTAKAVYDAVGQGGGATYSAGIGISIDTANTISSTLPISAGTGTNSAIIGYYNSSSNWSSKATGEGAVACGVGCSASTKNSFAVGYKNNASGGPSSSGNFAHGYMTIASGNRCHSEGLGTSSTADASHSEGNNTLASGNYSHSEGENVNATNTAEHSQGRYNVSSSASTTFGDSGNTLFSVGNGTAENARHNAFEIRQNGDIYCNNGTSDVKLQDYLQVKVVKISQADYDALVQGGTVDNNTLYIIA